MVLLYEIIIFIYLNMNVHKFFSKIFFDKSFIQNSSILKDSIFNLTNM